MRDRTQGKTMRKPRGVSPARPEGYLCEVECAAGLEPVIQDELRDRLGLAIAPRHAYRPRRALIGFDYTGDLHALLSLETVFAAYLVHHFTAPRPRALLGDQHLRALLDQIDTVRRLLAGERYRTVRISAAGSESPVMSRLAAAIARHAGLTAGAGEGDLLVRIRPAVYFANGWEASVRLSPRPLATRPWRVCNYQGALNASVAQALIRLTRPAADDVFLNTACGSGTLLIERRAWGPAQQLLGCDVDAGPLACARANIAASGYAGEIEIGLWDARALPLPERSVDALSADLPFGHLVGSHEENLSLYPALMQEAARVARPGARFALITHETRLMQDLLETSGAWRRENDFAVFLGDRPARIFVLSRSAGLA